MPKISVIVPIYNVEKYLSRCIESILNQTFTDFELILVDDGSPDKCAIICDEYAIKDNRITVIHKENGGLSDARNAGIDISRGEYLSFVDSDDWIHPQMLEIMYDSAKTQHIDIAICQYVETSLTKKNDVISEYKNIVYDRNQVLSCYTNTLSVIVCNKLFRRNLFEKIRFPVGKLHEDEFTTYKLIYNADKLVYIPVQLYYYYINLESITRKAYSEKHLDVLEAYEERCDFFIDRSENSLFVSALKSLFNGVNLQYAMARDANRNDICCYLKKRAKFFIKKYRKYTHINIEEYPMAYDMVYPRVMRIYRLLKRG